MKTITLLALSPLVLFLHIPFFCISSAQTTLDYAELALTASAYQQKDCTNSVITYLQDNAENKYLVKQIKFDDKPGRLAKAICEMVALDIGHSINVKLNHACLVPAGVPFVGKYLYTAATIHICAPGIGVGTYQKQHNLISFPQLILKQKPSHGLSRDLIYQMSRHIDFPPLVALDTFTGNGDRGQNNFFYDTSTDSFCGIDMASAFSLDLCTSSVKCIKALLASPECILEYQEYLGLTCYYQTLKQLVELYTPESLCAMIESYTQEAGFYADNFFDKVVQAESLQYLTKCKVTIHQSYYKLLELTDLLHKALKLTPKSKPIKPKRILKRRTLSH